MQYKEIFQSVPKWEWFHEMGQRCKKAKYVWRGNLKENLASLPIVTSCQNFHVLQCLVDMFATRRKCCSESQPKRKKIGKSSKMNMQKKRKRESRVWCLSNFALSTCRSQKIVLLSTNERYRVALNLCGFWFFRVLWFLSWSAKKSSCEKKLPQKFSPQKFIPLLKLYKHHLLHFMHRSVRKFNIPLPHPAQPLGIWTFKDWLVQILSLLPHGAKKPFKCPTN